MQCLYTYDHSCRNPTSPVFSLANLKAGLSVTTELIVINSGYKEEFSWRLVNALVTLIHSGPSSQSFKLTLSRQWFMVCKICDDNCPLESGCFGSFFTSTQNHSRIQNYIYIDITWPGVIWSTHAYTEKLWTVKRRKPH